MVFPAPLRPAATAWLALAAESHLILFPDHRLTRLCEVLNIEDVAGIDAAQNHQLTDFHRIDS